MLHVDKVMEMPCGEQACDVAVGGLGQANVETLVASGCQLGHQCHIAAFVGRETALVDVAEPLAVGAIKQSGRAAFHRGDIGWPKNRKASRRLRSRA